MEDLEKTQTDKKIEEIDITEFIEGESIFSSNGISKVKVTKDGITKIYRIPIQSTGVSELIDTYREKAPLPPKIQSWIDPESETGKMLGITKKTAVWVFDFTDQKYLKAKEDHESNLGMAIVLKGLAVNLKDKNGNIVIDSNKKVEILKGMGMSGDQFSQLVEDIQKLTRWTVEEKESFLE